ncbi:Uncharacterized conserved protein, DUF924 family [Paracoccus isoporae]|uniref:Uncharacterized conserved protein, DUF924 family n=1 Tax=Paracoccus isoporae TaxID=591205 RepID=A0A1G7E212_9RHOB|nr:DUF924 family protein [Paracoccus isoporae]SDE57540.1 Uncharacterized conserved protein, DUF924 family [Paracoccus isoporae]
MTADDVLTFWLDEIGEKGWYDASDRIDAACRDRFRPAWDEAERLSAEWSGTAKGALAALILTDQFPRNMFRNDARSFATDKLARRTAAKAIEAGFDMETDEPARQFFYMPFMHSEEMGDQNHAVALFEERMPGDNLRHARLHRDVIRRFGRFPWRNEVLGRETTPQERAFLEQGGYGAMVQGRLSLADPE